MSDVETLKLDEGQIGEAKAGEPAGNASGEATAGEPAGHASNEATTGEPAGNASSEASGRTDGVADEGTDELVAGDVAGQEIVAASPEAKRVALQLGTLFRRMLSYGAATSTLLDAGALGLSFLEFKTIMNLGVFEQRDNFCVADISESTGASMPAVSRAIDSLVRKGLVSRTEDPEDRRRRVISLTDEGRKVTDAALMGRAVGAVRLAGSFTEQELKDLDSLLSRLIEREDLASIHQELEGALDQ